MPDDQIITDEVSAAADLFAEQLTHDFKHEYSTNIIICIYPDLVTFHHAIHWPEAPDWLIGKHGNNTINNVSPNNPGPMHTKESIMRSNKSGLVLLYMYDKYPHARSIPRWLFQGVALYKAQFYSFDKAKCFTNDSDAYTAIKILENIDRHDTLAFDLANGFQLSYYLAAYLIDTQGWSGVLDLLDSYAANTQKNS
jgi:hypothetical protein